MGGAELAVVGGVAAAVRGGGALRWSRPGHVQRRGRRLRGSLAPVGAGRDGAGVFQAVIDDLDRKCSGLKESWLGRIAQAYKGRQTMAVAKTKGYVFRGREVVQTPQGPKVQLRFAVR